jgi:hypothetical protein
MSFRPSIVLIFAASLLMAPEVVRGQDQFLRVEVVGDSHPNFDPITIRVTNTRSMNTDLVIPANVLKNPKESFRNPLPVDVEKHAGNNWIVTRANGHGGVGRTMRPGQTLTFTLGISGVGEYRVRVWYVVDHGDPSPPRRMPVFGSVVSESFQVIPTPPPSN